MPLAATVTFSGDKERVCFLSLLKVLVAAKGIAAITDYSCSVPCDNTTTIVAKDTSPLMLSVTTKGVADIYMYLYSY